ncbi:MAG: hypothetical protein KDA61_02205 [Planctomycetales bacterium]|nr:hypothetical protein [Planctomycetales bacterium]
MHLTSRQNSRVKRLVKLRARRQREAEACLLIDGARECVRALAAGVELLEIYLCETLAANAEAREAWGQVRACGAEVHTVTPEVYEKIRFGQRSDGLVAVAAVPHRSLASVQAPEQALVAVVEGLEKPGNLGAILRSADGAGVDVVIAAGSQTDLYHPHVIRNSMGAVFRDNVVAASVEETLQWLRTRGASLLAARPDATCSYAEADYLGETAVLLGSEARGLSERWNAADISSIGLPMHGFADSLNVSAAAAVLFYEARRQRDAVLR